MNFKPFVLDSGWQTVLEEELCKPYVAQLAAFVEEERARHEVFPPKELMFNALRLTPYEKVKVVIVGQDPYHGVGQAHGLSFSVPVGVPPPPSLKNIYKELAQDVGIKEPEHGCLTSWAKQGVLLLNAVLTVRKGEANSHKGMGWERFTDAIIHAVCQKTDPVIFVLWGKSAQDKCLNVDGLGSSSKHFILKAPHPSPFSAHSGFLGCKHFSKINEILKSCRHDPINWGLE